MGGHILFDEEFHSAPSVCGLCLNTGQSCRIRLRKSIAGATVVDLDKSACPNLYKISLARAGKSTKASPCTNIPTTCQFCPSPSDAVWRYNTLSHIRAAHPTVFQSIDPAKYDISSDERVGMRARMSAKPRLSRKAKSTAMVALTISEEHTSTIPNLNADR